MFGMSLLNSIFLWGATAAAIPVVIHLIKRNRAVKLPFAAMRFLQIDPVRKFRSQRLKQILLLLLRITAFALLALAFARPFFKGLDAGSVWGSEQKAAVILVDNSLSMGYEDSFRKAADKVKEVLAGFKPGDQVTLVQFSDDATIIAETKESFSSLSKQLPDKLFLSSKGTNYMQALQTAEAILLQAPMDSKSIYLISDFQKTAWENLNPHWSIQSGIALNFLPVERSSFSNVAIMDVRISRDDLARKRADVLARVKNYSRDRKNFKIILSINGKKISRRNERLRANEEAIVQFQNVSFPDRSVFGSVDIDFEESLAADNQHFFVLENNTKTKILAINGEYNKDATRDELFYLDRAINLPSIARYSLVKTTPNKAKKNDFNDYRAIILANLKDLDRNTIQRLTYYVRAGGGLVFGLGDNVRPAVFNRVFRDLTPASIENLAFKALNRDNGVILAEIDYQHSIFRLFADPGQSDPSTAQFYQYFEVSPTNPEAVLAYFDDGSPAILENKVGNGKVILFTSTLDTEWNNLPIKAMFLPLLYRTLDYVVAEKKGQKSLLVGDSVPLQTPQINSSTKQDCYVRNPSGERLEQKNDVFDDTTEPGIYEIQKGRRTSYFAVNVDLRESDLTPTPPEELQHKAAEVSDKNYATAAIISSRLADQQEQRQKIWRLIIVAIILLLVGETWLANRTYR